MLNRSDYIQSNTFRRTIGILLVLCLTAFIGYELYPHIEQSFGQRQMRLTDISNMLEISHDNKEVPEKYSQLWKKHEDFCVALERISYDLDERLMKNRRYFDKAYTEQSLAKISEAINKDPYGCYFILVHNSLNSGPTMRFISMIIIRESYPKRYAIYSATKNLNSQHKHIVQLCYEILSNKYQRSSIKKKITPDFLMSYL